MKRSLASFSAVLALGLVWFSSGCASVRRPAAAPQSPHAFALAVTVLGGGQPTPEQWAVVQASFRRELAAQGWTLVDDLAQADRIIRVEFIPSVDDPALGRALVLSIRPNPAYGSGSVAFGGSSSASYGYGYSNNSLFGSSTYNALFGYSDPYYTNNYSTYYPAPTGGVAPPPVHHGPTNPADCPPGTTPGSRWAGTGDHPRPPSGDGNRWFHSEPPMSSRPEPSYSYSSSSSSMQTSYSRSEPSYSYSSPSPSYSSSSYSAPTPSYSSSSDSMSMSSSSSSASYSSPSPSFSSSDSSSSSSPSPSPQAER